MKCLDRLRSDFRRRWTKTSTWIMSISRNAFVVLIFSVVAYSVDGNDVSQFRAGPERRNKSTKNKEIMQNKSAKKPPCLINIGDRILALSFWHFCFWRSDLDPSVFGQNML